MFAIISKEDHSVFGHYIEKDEQKSEYDKTKWYLVEMTEENSPAYLPGRYINNQFVKEEL
jgi:hypothetical protein